MEKTLTKETEERIEKEAGKQVEKEPGEESGRNVREQVLKEVSGQSGENACEQVLKEVSGQSGENACEQVLKEFSGQSGENACEQVLEETGGQSGENADEQVRREIWERSEKKIEENSAEGEQEKNKTELLMKMKSMLDWYTFQATDEEFNVQEVDALVSAIKVMDSQNLVYGKGKARDFEQVLEYRREKLADAEKLASLYGSVDAGKAGFRRGTGHMADLPGRSRRKVHDIMHSTGVGEKLRIVWSKEGKKEGNRERIVEGNKGTNTKQADAKQTNAKETRIMIFNHYVKNPIMAAAILAALFVTSNGVGAAHTEKVVGEVFHWVYQNEYGAKIIITPQEEPETEDVVETGNIALIYRSVDEVPEEYQEWTSEITDMGTLEGYELSWVKVMENKSYIKLSCCMENKEQGDVIHLHKCTYRGELRIAYQRYDELDDMYEKETAGVNMQVFAKADNSDGEDFAIDFYHGNSKYSVSGKGPVETLEAIAEEYAGMMTKDDTNKE